MRLILGSFLLASVIYLPSVFAEKECMFYEGTYDNGKIKREREVDSFSCNDDQCSFLMRITNKAAKQAEFRLGCGNLTHSISGDRCATSKDGLEFFCVCEGDRCLGIGFIPEALDKFVKTGAVSIDVSNRRLGSNAPGTPLERDGGNGGGKETSNGSADAGGPSGGSPGTGAIPQDTPGGGNPAGGHQPTSHGSTIFVPTSSIFFIVAAPVLAMRL